MYAAGQSRPHGLELDLEASSSVTCSGITMSRCTLLLLSVLSPVDELGNVTKAGDIVPLQ